MIILHALLLPVPMPAFPRELRRDIGDDGEEGDDVEAEVLHGGEVPRRRLEVFRAPRRRHVLEQPDGVVHRVVPLQRQQVRQLVDVVVVAGKVFGPSLNYVRLDILPLSPCLHFALICNIPVLLTGL